MPATPDLRALLLTDVVDSTRLTEELGDAAMAELWTTHDRVARDLLPLWRGREIDKTDGMLLLFEDVRDAVGYALAYHRALAERSLPFKARAGIHVGTVSLRPNPPDDVARGAKPVEVDGLALPIAARVMSVALGAQTLLSADARRALGVVAHRVVSHGHWRMQGVADPVELFEVGDTGKSSEAPFRAPPDGDKVYRVMRQGDLWQPVREVRHSVPAERDSFVGRQEPLELLAKKFEAGARLVSVLGMGGTGKTRLVTRFAWTVLGDHPGGVWFCDLSQARTFDGIHFAVAQGLDVPLGKTDPVVQLAHAIAGRGRCLVILDNFEQVARFAEETLGKWLDRAPLAQFLVTTREVLGIVGEETLALAPMRATDATALFLRRAESARFGYAPSADDRAAIDQLVKVLDGLPLAIELAAARVRVMAPRTLLGRMHERFSILLSRAGRRDRQATLRATFDWSWELLDEAEKATLAQLSVFEGGFSLESADRVVDLSELPLPPSPVDAIQGLVDKSFVRQLPESRFDLLESVRDYAAEHLRSQGRFTSSGAAAHLAARRRHWSYFAKLDERAATAHGCIEANNLVAACRSALEHEDGPSATGALAGTWSALKLCGPFRVALELSVAVASIPDLPSADKSTVDWVAASAHYVLGHGAESRRHIESGLDRSRADGDQRQEAHFLCALGEQHPAEGDPMLALTLLGHALHFANDCGDHALVCRVLSSQGTVCYDMGLMREARTHYETALAAARACGDERWEGGILGNLGNLLFGEGLHAEALELYEECLRLTNKTGDRRWVGNTRSNLGLLHHEQGRTEQARIELEEALDIARSMGHSRLECTVLCNLGIVLEALGETGVARAHYESAVTLANELADRRSEGQFRGYLGLLLASTGNTSAGFACLDVGETLLVETADQWSLGLLLCRRAEAEHRAGRAASAGLALQRVQSIVRSAKATRDSELGKALTVLSEKLLTKAPSRSTQI